MADIVREILGGTLYAFDAAKPFPSPQELKNRILLKGDRSHAHEKSEGGTEGCDDDGDDDEMPEGNVPDADNTAVPEMARKKRDKEKKEKVIEEWSRLIGIPANHQKNVPLNDIVDAMPEPKCKMQSFAEAKALKLLQKNKNDFIDFNLYLLSRIYPYGGRIDSSNMNPLAYWSAGCNAVAMNFQTGDVSSQTLVLSS